MTHRARPAARLTRRLGVFVRPLCLLTATVFAPACATLDGAGDASTLYAHGPRAAPGGGWVVVVTAQELAALGVGQKMELDTLAPDVVYVVDYGRADQLDAVFARTLGGLMPIRMLLPPLNERGRVVLRTRPCELPESSVSGDIPANPPDAGVSDAPCRPG